MVEAGCRPLVALQYRSASLTIFLYGTLQLGKQNQHILKELNGTWKKGYVIRTLINKGWGSEYRFPGLKLNKNRSKICGMLFQSKELKNNK